MRAVPQVLPRWHERGGVDLEVFRPLSYPFSDLVGRGEHLGLDLDVAEGRFPDVRDRV